MEQNSLLEHLEERHILASIADIIGTMHKIDAKVSKLHEVVVGDKEFGQEGIIAKIRTIKEDVEKIEKDVEFLKKYDIDQIYEQVDGLNAYKNRLIGFAIGGGLVWALILKALDNMLLKK